VGDARDLGVEGDERGVQSVRLDVDSGEPGGAQQAGQIPFA
jgi:hypothetical protein